MFGYNAHGGSVRQHMPKYMHVQWMLFSKVWKKLFKNKPRSKYMDLLPKRVILKLWIDYKQFQLFAPIWRRYYNWKNTRLWAKIEKMQEEREKQDKEEAEKHQQTIQMIRDWSPLLSESTEEA